MSEANSIRRSGQITLILSAVEQGDPQAAEQLLPLAYAEHGPGY